MAIAAYRRQHQGDDPFIMSNKKFLLIAESSQTPDDLSDLEPALEPLDPIKIRLTKAGVLNRDYSQQVYGLTDGRKVGIYIATELKGDRRRADS